MEACVASAVLRVRRKRGEEPPEALFVPCKRQRREDGGEDWGSPPSLPLGQNIFFKLAATVSSQHEPVPKYVREALHRQRATRALKPSCQSQQRIRQHLLARKQGSRQDERYRLLSRHRAPASQAQAQAPQPPPDPAHTTQGHQLDSGHTTPKSQGQQGATLPQAPSAQGFHSFDSVPQATSDKEKPCTPDTCTQDPDPDVILSHAVKLMREHLAISEEGKGRQHREREQDYVY
ncbi:probable RNA polymerase II nuclear localization protein SLC7A6OS, partial [Gracilinanus agilis]|uniref:probable RNA polymerase II nuclear localization protein SLC7A6OS n=1 Tax=Gracilinanus agilis TaxID=191870 RepID=UPI001CFD873F